jgi:hypothetical protein
MLRVNTGILFCAIPLIGRADRSISLEADGHIRPPAGNVAAFINIASARMSGTRSLKAALFANIVSLLFRDFAPDLCPSSLL